MNILLSQLTKLTPTIKHCLIDVATAKIILVDRRYENQRALKHKIIANYVNFMKDNDWSEVSIIRFGCSAENSKWRLIDGQHRLNAVCKSELAQTFKIEFDTFETEAEMKDAYGKMDRGAPRTDQDAIQVYGEFPSVGTTINSFISALKLIEAKFNANKFEKFSPSRLKKLYDEWLPSAIEMRDLYAGCNISPELRMPTKRSSTFAVFMYLLRFADDKEKAVSFIKSICEDSGLIANSPTKHAAEVLKGFHVRNHVTGKRSLDSRDLSVFLISCWNQFAANKSTCRRPALTGGDAKFSATKNQSLAL